MSKHLKICMCYPGFPPESFSWGIGTLVFEYFQMLKGNNVFLIIISRTLDNQYSTKRLSHNSILIRIPTQYYYYEKVVNQLLGNYLNLFFYSIRLHFLLRKINRRCKFDFIESTDWGGETFFSLFTKLRQYIYIRVSTPSFVSESYNPQNKSYLSGFSKYMEKQVLKRAMHVIIPNKNIINDFISNGIKRNDYIEQFLYPLDLEEKPINRKQNKNDDPVKFIFTGRLEERKGIESIFYSISKLIQNGNTNFTFTLVGPDTYTKRNIPISQKLINKYNLNQYVNNIIFLKGAFEREHLLKHLQDYDYFVFSSNFELVGFSALEAVYCGLPIISSRTGHLFQILENKTDYLSFSNTDELFSIMLDCINKDVDRYTIAKNAQTKVIAQCNHIDSFKNFISLIKK